MAAVDSIKAQIENFKKDHEGKAPLFLETSPEVFQSLKSHMRAKGQMHLTYEKYVVFDGVEIFEKP